MTSHHTSPSNSSAENATPSAHRRQERLGSKTTIHTSSPYTLATQRETTTASQPRQTRFEITTDYISDQDPHTTRRFKTEGIDDEKNLRTQLVNMDNDDATIGVPLSEEGVEGRRAMPLQNDKGALAYTGGLVGRYLRDVEDLVRRCGGGDEHNLYYAVYYCDDARERQFISLYGRMATKGWKEFKKAVLAQFEGSETMREEYTVEMVEQVVADRVAKGIRGREDIVAYQRDFQAISNELLANGEVSEGEMGRLFMKGLTKEVKEQLQLRLAIRFPKHLAKQHHTVRELVNTLLYLADTGGLPTTVVKMEDSGDMRAFAEAVKGFTAAVERLGPGRNMSAPSFAMAAPQAFAGLSAPPWAPAGTVAAPRSMACNFCGGLDHFVCICPKAEE